MSAHYLKKYFSERPAILLSVQPFNEENDLSTLLILPCLYCFPVLCLITVPEAWKACLNPHSALCPSLHEWVRCAKRHQRFCRRRESPDCVISNSSLLLLKPWAVLVCWRLVWLLILNVSAASGMLCTCSSAPMPLVRFVSYTYTRGQYYITGGKAFIYTFDNP